MRAVVEVVEWCRATPRRLWWSAVVVFCVLGGCWSIATPLFASPDEPAHVVRAASVVRGEILGDDLPEHAPRGLRGSLLVTLPEIFASGSRVGCYAFQPDTPANCAAFTGSTTREEKIPTSAGRHPPWYYAVVGLPSLVFVSGAGVRLMRLLNVALTALLLASALVTLVRFPRFRLVAVGLAVAVTPMVLFLAGVVNPSSIEIAAGILFWVATYTLVTEAPERVDGRVVLRAAIAGCVLALTRQLGPGWLVLISLILFAIAGRAVVRTLWAERAVRIAVAAIGACCVAQALWIAATGTLDASNSNVPGVPGSTSHLISGSVGRGLLYYHELIGVFGWRDTSPPTAVWLFWTAVLSGLVGLAVLAASRRVLLGILVTAALTWLLPVVFEARSAGSAGYFWQGRYTLPFAVGVPLLAAFAVAGRGLSRTVTARLTWIVGVALGASQVLAFVQAIHRYAVGTRHKFDFFASTPWEPPLPALLLTVVFVVAVGAWYLLLVARGGADEEELAPVDRELLEPRATSATG